MLFLLQNDKITIDMGENAYESVYAEYNGTENIKKIINMWKEIIKN